MDIKENEFIFQARWADMDFNGHMKNTSYLEYCSDSRMLYFKRKGFPLSEFGRLGFGPVIFQDTINYYKEVMMYEEFIVSLVLQGKSGDGSCFVLVNNFSRPGGEKIARVTSTGCWFDLNKRKPTVPPDNLLELIEGIPKTNDFSVIGQPVRGSGQ